jgi:dephospho-CoA kinase
MLVVALTGGIGSGKSAVAKLFAELGTPIIDADIVAREVTAKDQPAYIRIIKHFGNEILLPDGNLDRARLRQLIFNKQEERLWLERLLHPQIREQMQTQIAALKAPYCIAVIPLLLEVEFYSFINRILVVDTPEDEQIKRVMQRDKAERPAVEAILHSQASREARKKRAHDVIINDGSMEDLLPQVKKLHEMYMKLA